MPPPTGRRLTSRYAANSTATTADAGGTGPAGRAAHDRTPISEAPFAADSPQGAANVVQTYYALIGEGKYRRRGSCGATREASGQSADAFVASFAKYSEYHANIGAPGRRRCRGGQRYVTVPVQAYARLKEARRLLDRRAMLTDEDIDGATAEDKEWRINSIDLKPATPAAK